ncbi:MAG: tRNA 4-thiouridine(8) synthase ThiI [Ruminococcaceae bacterium]|nr:tRNA 4-thiouridine(8) synthase ThiI [Oscillospiraceae bacterium]
MKELILIKNGELALKGLNRSSFESVMAKNIKRRLSDLGKIEIKCQQSTMTVEPVDDNYDMEEAIKRLSMVFGIAGFQRAAAVEKDMEVILKTAPVYLKNQMEGIKTFKVEAKRSDKKFPLKSPEISRDVGEVLLRAFPHLKVDVHNPDVTVTVEIRDKLAFIRGDQIKGAGGMPVSTGGKAAVLISGGIDSPVAAWMMAKRGVVLDAVHFASPPFTSPQSEQKVHDLLGQVARYSGSIALYTVPFTEIQQQIRANCPEELFTLIMRRFMMRISCRIAAKNGCGALITGESIGQVASQTMPALACTDEVADMPVFRPLIAMDKEEIISISRKIETFDISILPYEDCCTVFTPKHPRTRPKPEMLREAEKALDVEALVNEAVDNTRYEIIGQTR